MGLFSFFRKIDSFILLKKILNGFILYGIMLIKIKGGYLYGTVNFY